MAQNKGATVRYRAIDKCLSSKHGRYNWEDLQSKLADKLHLNGTQESVIGFEQNMDFKGLENITSLTRITSSSGFRRVFR